MKRNILSRAIAVMAVLMTALPAASFAQGHVYMYDRGHQRPSTRPGIYASEGAYFGFRMGVNAAQVRSESTYFESNSPRAGLAAGFVGGAQVAPHAPVFFESGLMYVEKGGKSDYGGDFTHHFAELSSNPLRGTSDSVVVFGCYECETTTEAGQDLFGKSQYASCPCHDTGQRRYGARSVFH